MTNEELTYKIRGCIFEVFKEMGPGLLETVYEAALCFELRSQGLDVECQVPIIVKYKDTEFGLGFRIDVLVEEEIIIEIKSVESLQDIHKKKLTNYLKLTKNKIGFLVNFNCKKLIDRESIFRIINDY